MWQDANGHDLLAAKVVDGKATRFSFGLLGPFEVYQRADTMRNGAWLAPALYTSLGALLLTVLLWPVAAIVRRKYRARLDLAPRDFRAYRAGKIGALLMLLAFGAWIASIISMFSDLNKTTEAFDPVIRFDQIFGFVAFIGGFVLILWNLWSVWSGGRRRWPAKLWSVVLALSGRHRPLGRICVPPHQLGSPLLMKALRMHVAVEKLRLAKPFRISGFVFEVQDAVVVTLDDGACRGVGEASGVYYLGDTAERWSPRSKRSATRSKTASIASLCRTCCHRVAHATRSTARSGTSRRNGKDARCGSSPASRRSGRWSRRSRSAPTIPRSWPTARERYAHARALKMKLTGDLDLDIARVKAVREARPDVWLGVDANQGYGMDALDTLMPVLVDARVSLLEQPIRRGREADLDGYHSPIPIAADESVLRLADVPGAAKRFNVVNIKLDKCGGLTEALAMAHDARQLGLGVMVGNMVGTSLAMAPAFVVGQLCDVVDLDGPIFLAADREPGLTYEDGMVWCGRDVWGSRQAVAA